MFEVTTLSETERESLQRKLKSERRSLIFWAIILVFDIAIVVINLSGGNAPTEIEGVNAILLLCIYLGVLPLTTGIAVSSLTKYLETLSDLQVYRIKYCK